MLHDSLLAQSGFSSLATVMVTLWLLFCTRFLFYLREGGGVGVGEREVKYNM